MNRLCFSFKKFFGLAFIIMASFLAVRPVAALDIKEVLFPYYSAVDSCGPVGPGPLFGPRFPQGGNAAQLQESITKYITNTRPDSPLIGAAADFVSLGQQYNVNPAFVVSIAQKETSLATAGNALPPQYNIFNIRNGPNGSFGSYESVRGAIEAVNKLLAGDLYLGPPANFTTIEQIMYRYAPPADNNDTGGYVGFIRDVMQKILAGTLVTETSSSACPTGGSNADGSIGWTLDSGQHAIVSYDQIDPKWSGHPYGVGKASIGESGCGPTSLAMVAATLTGNKGITPVTLADQYGDVYHKENGTDWAVMPVFAKDYSLQYVDLDSDLTLAADMIRNGGLVVVSVKAGHFTNSGHIMVLRAITPDGSSFYLADPNGAGYSGDSETKAFSKEFLVSDGALVHAWGFTK